MTTVRQSYLPLVLVALAMGCDSASRSKQVDFEKRNLTVAAGDFTQRFLATTGDSVALFDGTSRITLIHIGAAACQLCRTSLPVLYKVRSAYPDSLLRTVVVAMDPLEDQARVQAFAGDVGANAVVLHDPEQRLLQIVNLLGTPAMVIIDRSGRQFRVYQGVGTSLSSRVLAGADSAIRLATSGTPPA